MYKLFPCMLTKVDHYKLSSCMQHHLLSCLYILFSTSALIFDFLFLFNFNFENVKEWFCVSPFTF